MIKEYQEAINDRYETEIYSSKETLDNVYSLINQIGQYGLQKHYSILSWFIRCVMKESEKDLFDIQYLDVGCGKGTVTRIIQELCPGGGICGFDMSKQRIEFCKSLSHKIKYAVGDACYDFQSFGRTFDAVSVMDVFMFLKSERDIMIALKNIYESLSYRGLFLWYEINEDTHFKDTSSDSLGFSRNEMDKLAEKAGFTLFASKQLYKNISIFNKKISTFYLADKIGPFWCDVINKLYPGQSTINIRIYRKSNLENIG